MDSKKKAADSNIKVCANCGLVDVKLDNCAKCKAARYCSRACQKQHWRNGHRELCVTPKERRPQAITTRGSNKRHTNLRLKDDGGDAAKCPICMDFFSDCAVCTLPCNHAFHHECVEQLRKHGVQQVCPLCRAALPDGPAKLYEDATRMFVAVMRQVGGDDPVLWQSLTAYQQQKMTMAIDMYTSAANQGDASAQFHLGSMYLHGTGVAQDQKEAAQWHRKAADQGNAYAQCTLGIMYQHGRGVAQDHKGAVQWYRKAADQGFANAQYNLGTMYHNGEGISQDHKEVVQWYRKAADQGHAHAQCNLGNIYYNGKGVAQNYKKAIQWFRKAADQGGASAQFNLGGMYHHGTGVAEDHQKAVQWYRKAANQGFSNAQCNLGNMYSRGEGVARDDKKAVEWYRKAANQGDANAQYNLGVSARRAADVYLATVY